MLLWLLVLCARLYRSSLYGEYRVLDLWARLDRCMSQLEISLALPTQKRCEGQADIWKVASKTVMPRLFDWAASASSEFGFLPRSS